MRKLRGELKSTVQYRALLNNKRQFSNILEVKRGSRVNCIEPKLFKQSNSHMMPKLRQKINKNSSSSPSKIKFKDIKSSSKKNICIS